MRQTHAHTQRCVCGHRVKAYRPTNQMFGPHSLVHQKQLTHNLQIQTICTRPANTKAPLASTDPRHTQLPQVQPKPSTQLAASATTAWHTSNARRLCIHTSKATLCQAPNSTRSLLLVRQLRLLLLLDRPEEPARTANFQPNPTAAVATTLQSIGTRGPSTPTGVEYHPSAAVGTYWPVSQTLSRCCSTQHHCCWQWPRAEPVAPLLLLSPTLHSGRSRRRCCCCLLSCLQTFGVCWWVLQLPTRRSHCSTLLPLLWLLECLWQCESIQCELRVLLLLPPVPTVFRWWCCNGPAGAATTPLCCRCRCCCCCCCLRSFGSVRASKAS